jgi:hypothetical protein
MDKQYLGFRHTASSGTTTATIDAFLMPQDEITEKFKGFPKAVDADV